MNQGKGGIFIFNLIFISAIVSIIALLSVAYFNRFVSKHDSGTKAMKELQNHIREGAKTFMFEEIKVFIFVLIGIALILWYIFYWEVAVAFLIGGALSMTAGLVGMHGATLANAKVANSARSSIKEALNVAMSGGAIMGFVVAGLAVGGLTLIIFIFAPEFSPEMLAIESKPLVFFGDLFNMPT